MKNFICSLAIILSCFSLSGAEQYHGRIALSYIDTVIKKIENLLDDIEVRIDSAKTEEEWNALYEDLEKSIMNNLIIVWLPYLTDEQVSRLESVRDRQANLHEVIGKNLGQ